MLRFSLAGCVGPEEYVDDGPYYGNNIDVGLGFWGLSGGYGGGHGYHGGGGHGGRR